MADQVEVKKPGAAIQSFGDLEGYVDFLRDQGVESDTLRRVMSGELPMDNRSRMRRAREMGLDTQMSFKRLDVPGRTTMTKSGLGVTPGTSGTGLVYSAPHYDTAAIANQTGGQARYPLMFPEGILGLHPGVIRSRDPEMLLDLISQAATDAQHLYYPGRMRQELDKGDYDMAGQLEWMIRHLDEPHPGKTLAATRAALRKSLTEATKLPSKNDPGWDKNPEFMHMVANSVIENAGQGHIDGHWRDLNPEADLDSMWDQDEERFVFPTPDPQILNFNHMDRGQSEILKHLGFTGSVVDDEAGMSVASFYPERVRHKSLSALDPRAKGRSNIFQSLLAPVAGAGAAASLEGEE
jgi:hypothetical protein